MLREEDLALYPCLQTCPMQQRLEYHLHIRALNLEPSTPKPPNSNRVPKAWSDPNHASAKLNLNSARLLGLHRQGLAPNSLGSFSEYAGVLGLQ